MFFVQISLGFDVWTRAAHQIKCGRTAHTPALREHIGPKQDREGTINPQLHNFFAGGNIILHSSKVYTYRRKVMQSKIAGIQAPPSARHGAVVHRVCGPHAGGCHHAEPRAWPTPATPDT